jgi:hypothetical protein
MCQHVKGPTEKAFTTVFVQHDGSAGATHGCQSRVDEVIEDETMMLSTRFCWTKRRGRRGDTSRFMESRRREP